MVGAHFLAPSATTGTVIGSFRLPAFNSGVAFDTIRIELATFPEGAQKLITDNLIASPADSSGGTMLLANPNWNITLSDFGYSDYLLDNTPVGRKMASR